VILGGLASRARGPFLVTRSARASSIMWTQRSEARPCRSDSLRRLLASDLNRPCTDKRSRGEQNKGYSTQETALHILIPERPRGVIKAQHIASSEPGQAETNVQQLWD